jgi:hypothetical protein
LARTQGQVLEQPFKVFEAPDAYLATYKSYDGYHFPADAMYSAPSRPAGALITVWHAGKQPEKAAPVAESGKGKKGAAVAEQPVATPTPTAPKDGKAKVQVYDAAGVLVRSFSVKIDTGINRISWDLRADGVRFPSRQEPRGEADQLPAGMEVIPGDYKLVFSFGEMKDSTMVKVHGDPRRPVSDADRRAKLAAYAEYKKVVEQATASFQLLKEARKTIKLVGDALVNAPDSVKKEITQTGKGLQDSIAALEKLFMMPDDLKGIQRSSDDLSFYLRVASQYMNAGDGAPGPNATHAIQQARNRVAPVVDKVNTFVSGPFAQYRQQVEQVSFSLFKDMKPVKQE